MTLAAAVTIGLALAVAARRGLPMVRATTSILLMAAAVPVGARLLHAAINTDLYRSEPDRLLSTDLGSFSLYGGLLLALTVGLATARIGCFLAGCCFGVQTELPWGVTFPVGSYAHLYQLVSGVGTSNPTV